MEETVIEKEIELTLDEATEFFADLYCGEHHIPNKIIRYGRGWCVNDYIPMATYDFDRLTKLVVMAHDRCIRAEIYPSSGGKFKVAIWKRKREGTQSFKHSTMEEAIERIRKYDTYYKPKN